MAKTDDVAYQTEAEKEHFAEEQPERHTEHPMSLAARRLLSDELVQQLFTNMLDTFGTGSIMSQTVEAREKSREQFLVVSGLKNSLEQMARGEIPKSML